MRGGTKTSSFNTSNLISHLRKNHSEVHTAFVRQSNAKQLGKDALKKTTQLSLSQQRKNKNTTKNTQEQKRSVKKFWSSSHWITSRFSIVQDARFSKLVEFLEPCFAMPSRKYFSDVCLPELYSVVHWHVENLISDALAMGGMKKISIWRYIAILYFSAFNIDFFSIN